MHVDRYILLQKNLDEFIEKELINLKENFTGEPNLLMVFKEFCKEQLYMFNLVEEKRYWSQYIVALFSEKESHAVYFLDQQNMS